MIRTSENDHEYRCVDHGPKYLVKDKNYDMGVVVLKPGQEFDKHYHAIATESFLTIAGEVHMHVNDQIHVLKEGDVLCCEPNDSHFVINRGCVDWKAVFIKSPPIVGDSIYENMSHKK
ncbi:cupin domain-containing protein [Photobacterium nomapromontoriensis]|uniref:cupin domain-containing protein n=1 Tax=Photobacterium nomapromontoriensis TaxID=2910237 RepID=UPI003D09D537